jgi:LuxR family transcriptional regulator, maltose regulon positive regulatory protein
MLPQLVNRLSEVSPVVVILDDFHRLSAGPARESVAWFLDHAPANVQLVVSTRTEPLFGLASLRAYGELVELRNDDLRLTNEEAAALLSDRLELGLAQEDVNLLVERTDVWVAGVYLATFSLARTDGRHTFLVRFGGTHRHVVDFLSDEVLASHEPTLLELMLGCSVLERFNGPLCDFVLEREGSSAMLADLVRSNLFLVPLDDEMGWYRFHHPFSQLLKMELGRREPERPSTIHRRASR